MFNSRLRGRSRHRQDFGLVKPSHVGLSSKQVFLGSRANQGFGWVKVPTTVGMSPSRVLMLESQSRGFKYSAWFWLGLSPSHMLQVPRWAFDQVPVLTTWVQFPSRVFDGFESKMGFGQGLSCGNVGSSPQGGFWWGLRPSHVGLSPKLGVGWVRVSAMWGQVPRKALASFQSQTHGFKSQEGFSSVWGPATWICVPSRDFARFESWAKWV